MTGTRSLPGPFVGPRPFDEDQAAFFHGRDRARRVICAHVNVSPLTVLYGPGGAGKSSILRAGVVPALREDAAGRVVVFHDQWLERNPVRRLMDLVKAADTAARQRSTGMQGPGGAPAVPSTEAPVHAPDSIRAVLDASQSSDGPLVFVFDQIEDYLLSDIDVGATSVDDPDVNFDAWLATIINRKDVRASVLISIREDYLAMLDRFRARIPGLFGNMLRLDPLTAAEVRAAIHQSVASYQRLRPAAPGVAGVNDDVVSAVIAASVDGRSVSAAAVQVVMARLWREAVGRGAGTAAAGRGAAIDLALLHALGGADRIVNDDLEERLRSLTERDRDRTLQMFRYMLTPSGYRLAYTATDLATYLPPERDESADAVRADTERVLARLEQLGVVRAGSRSGPLKEARYEISTQLPVQSVMHLRRTWYPDPGDVIASAVPTFLYAVFSVEEQEARCTIDEQGSGTLVRHWIGITMNQTVIDLRLPYRMHSSAVDVMPPIAVSSAGLTARFVSSQTNQPGILEGHVVVEGKLELGTRFDLQIKQVFDRAFRMRSNPGEKPSESSWHGEYAGSETPFNVSRLRVVVEFPLSHHALSPPPEAVVFMTRTERVFGRETSKLRGKVSFEGGVAKLEVEKPAPNLLYAIAWVPPAAGNGGQR